MKTLRLILGDQLNPKHTWFQQEDPQVTYLMCEMRQETDYALHHVQKVLAFFLAMRRFAEQMSAQGHQFIYYKLDDPRNRQDLIKNIDELIQTQGFQSFGYLWPDEYRLDKQLKDWCDQQSIPITVEDTQHFLTSRTDWQEHFKDKKTYTMEFFYRAMRKKTGYLMTSSGQPEGGQWNFDTENRKTWNGTPSLPKAPVFDPEIDSILSMLQEHGVKTMGISPEPGQFLWATTREEAEGLLRHFVEHLLPHFGRFQDAMHPDEPILFHSRLSFCLNTKIISPQEVVEAAIEAWKKSPERIELAQVEGFVRQLIGWREYVRGFYWAHMPGYPDLNFFDHQNKLPDFYWTAQTQMACVKSSIQHTLDNAYAHHIERLMVTGNLALLLGVAPKAIESWYLGVYIDAIEWVEMPNTLGMSQFVDGGKLATKPYISSANYLHKMGKSCTGCRYNPKERLGDSACPFNALYWRFLGVHRPLLGQKERMRMMYALWDKIPSEEQQQLIVRAEKIIEQPDMY